MIDFWSVYTNFDILRSIATKAFFYCKKNSINTLIFIHFNNHIKHLIESSIQINPATVLVYILKQ